MSSRTGTAKVSNYAGVMFCPPPQYHMHKPQLLEEKETVLQAITKYTYVLEYDIFFNSAKLPRMH
jgi:hypothetical protein